MEKLKEETAGVGEREISFKQKQALAREKAMEELEKGVSKALDEAWGEVKPEFIEKFLEKLREQREIRPLE